MNLLPYVSHHLQWVVVLLVLVGIFLKRIKGLSNGLIPMILVVLSIIVCTVYSCIRMDTGLLVALTEYGIPDGVPLAATAAWSWDIVHGVSKMTKQTEAEK